MPFAYKIDDQLDLGSLPMPLPGISARPFEAHDPQYSPQSHLPVSSPHMAKRMDVQAAMLDWSGLNANPFDA